MRLLPPLLAALALAAACRAPSAGGEPRGEAAPDDPRRRAVEVVLDDFHRAASEADGARYFDHLSEDAVFLGTDATERWTKAAFRAYAEPHFAEGRGWTYVVTERHVFLGPDRRSAWFDERLVNESYGDCRGTGALRLEGNRWRICQYNLSFPIPNELAHEFVQRIRDLDPGAQ